MSIKKAYVIGTNVSASMSPTIFRYWFNKYNISRAEYKHKEIKKENFDKEIKSIFQEDGLVGLNVTIPYKEKILYYMDNKNSILKPPSVNCVTIKKTNDSRKATTVRLGKNTDTTGFDKALYSSGLSDFFYTHKNCCAIVLGYGGAAKAAIQALLLDSNFKRIIVFNRTFSKLNNIKEVFDKEIESYKIEELNKHIKNAQLIVSTTPTNPLSDSIKWNINSACVGFDMVYQPKEGTGFLSHFKKNKRIEGIHMLIHQAVPCFKEWFGVEPEACDTGLLETLYKKMNEK